MTYKQEAQRSVGTDNPPVITPRKSARLAKLANKDTTVDNPLRSAERRSIADEEEDFQDDVETENLGQMNLSLDDVEGEVQRISLPQTQWNNDNSRFSIEMLNKDGDINGRSIVTIKFKSKLYRILYTI